MFKGGAFLLIIYENNDAFTKTICSYMLRGHSTMHLKDTKEILKNTKENIGQRDFSFFTPYNIYIGDFGYWAVFLWSIRFF